MTARSIPPLLERRDGYIGEFDVWERLCADLPDGTVLLCGAHVPEGPSGREIDFLVLWPGVGIGVIEVKGGAVACDSEGVWSSSRNGVRREIGNPMEQVETARHALQRALFARGLPASRARTQHLLVLPHTTLPASFDPASCPRHLVLDKAQQPELVPLLRAQLEAGSGHAPLDAEDVEGVVRMFAQELLPDPTADAAEHEQRADQLAVQQVDVLDLLSRQRSFTVIGGAGTGKTALALGQAQRQLDEGRRVALVCYSQGLAAHLRRQTEQWTSQPDFVGTFHALAKSWGVEDGAGDVYFEETVPTRLRELAEASGPRYDAVVVDEAQDLGESWWPALQATLTEPDSGIFAFLDDGQRLFERLGRAPVPGEPFPLRRNFRNTKRIAQMFGSLASELPKFDGRQGPQVRFVPCVTEDAVSRADDTVEALLDTWAPGQVALLTTHHRHPVQVEATREGHDAYWQEFFAEQDVFYGSVSGFKGLERTCVVLAVNGFSATARAKEMLYVGLSRARSQLVVVGDLDVIAPPGERDGVRTRLQKAARWEPPVLT